MGAFVVMVISTACGAVSYSLSTVCKRWLTWGGQQLIPV